MRITQRLAQLERTLGRCPDCSPTIELVHDRATASAPISYCRTCGQPLARITVLLGFDPTASGER